MPFKRLDELKERQRRTLAREIRRRFLNQEENNQNVIVDVPNMGRISPGPAVYNRENSMEEGGNIPVNEEELAMDDDPFRNINRNDDVLDHQNELNPVEINDGNEVNPNREPEINEDGEENHAEENEFEGEENAGENPGEMGLNEENFVEDDDEPLYNNARITVKESMLCILSLMTRHNLTLACVSDFIEALEILCPAEGLKHNSIHIFKKYCKINDEAVVVKHFYCSQCLSEKQNENDRCDNCQTSKIEYFVELPFSNQLQSMFSRRSFRNKLQDTIARRIECRDEISDIYDGTVYKTMVNNGFLRNPNNISFTWYSDAFPVFKSSGSSVTTLCLRINELPPEDRKLRENILILAVWFGKVKIHFNHVLLKLIQKLNELYNGIPIYIPGGQLINVRGVILLGTCDLPAKSECLNFMQFNGKFGCTACLTEGKIISIGPRSHLQCYPYVGNIQERNSGDSLVHADRAEPGAPHLGVKGHTGLSRVMPDFIGGMGIDRMHGAEGGVWLRLLSKWFSPQYSNLPCSLFEDIDEINARLKSIKPPNFVHRMPRDIRELSHWKASELKMFLFYYAIPVFHGLMDADYFGHMLKLMLGLTILSSDTIPPNMIEAANRLLNQFVKDFCDLYGHQFMTINVHQLQHMASCVKRLGPLWAYTCYEFEDLNGRLLRSVHGTRFADTQIASLHHTIVSMTGSIEELSDGIIKKFCLKKKNQVKINEEIGISTYTAGGYNTYRDIPQFVFEAFRLNGMDINEFTAVKYLRLLKNKKLYISESYTRNTQTCSSVIQYEMGGEIFSGSILFFLRLRRNDCRHRNCNCLYHHYAIVQDIVLDNYYTIRVEDQPSTTENYVYRCHKIDNHRVIPVASIKMSCFYMDMNGQAYVVFPINSYECE